MNINNINFTSFIRVVEAGSFNKAAENLHFISTALIQQINLLVNPCLLKVLSYYIPEDFPYYAHWKMEECHNAY